MSQPNPDVLERILRKHTGLPTKSQDSDGYIILLNGNGLDGVMRDIQELYVLKSDVEEQLDLVMREQLVLFGAELAYCLVNNFPIGEGHTPPSMTYESMEGTVNKWVESRQKIATKLNLNKES